MRATSSGHLHDQRDDDVQPPYGIMHIYGSVMMIGGKNMMLSRNKRNYNSCMQHKDGNGFRNRVVPL